MKVIGAGWGRTGTTACGGSSHVEHGSSPAIVPQPGTVLQQGDVVHVIAQESDIDRIAAAFAAREGSGH